MDGFRRSSESRSSSETPVLSQHELAQLEETSSSLDSPVMEPMSMEWTDEKHSLYLKSMEASFVNQLHNSMDLLGWRSRKEKRQTKSHYNSNTQSGEFKVLRGGCWQKIKFEKRGTTRLNKVDESRDFLASPWFQHFRSACKPQVGAFPSLAECNESESQAANLSGQKAMCCGSATSSKQFHGCHSCFCHHDLVGSNTEGSDQNFVDEVMEGEKATGVCSSKRMKTLIDSSGNDQVVPD